MASKKNHHPEPESEPEFELLIFQEDDASVPLLEWLAGLTPRKAVAKCETAILILREHGQRLRRPYADSLRDGIHELRAHCGTVQYRMLYFFHERSAVLTHGIIKKGSAVPDKEIDRAIAYRERYRQAPARHTYRLEKEE